MLSKITKLKQHIDSEEEFYEYGKTSSELEKLYDNIGEGAKIRSKYSWYQCSEKSAKFFYNLEKRNYFRETIKTLLGYGKEITTPSEISLTLKKFIRTCIKNLSHSIFLISKCS